MRDSRSRPVCGFGVRHRLFAAGCFRQASKPEHPWRFLVEVTTPEKRVELPSAQNSGPKGRPPVLFAARAVAAPWCAGSEEGCSKRPLRGPLTAFDSAPKLQFQESWGSSNCIGAAFQERGAAYVVQVSDPRRVAALVLAAGPVSGVGATGQGAGCSEGARFAGTVRENLPPSLSGWQGRDARLSGRGFRGLEGSPAWPGLRGGAKKGVAACFPNRRQVLHRSCAVCLEFRVFAGFLAGRSGSGCRAFCGNVWECVSRS